MGYDGVMWEYLGIRQGYAGAILGLVWGQYGARSMGLVWGELGVSKDVSMGLVWA